MKVDNRRYDTEKLRREHPLESVAPSYGVELRAEGKAFIGLCPFHADRQTPNFYVYPASLRWWCYVCKQGGDVIEFVRRRENISFLDACEKLEGTTPSAREEQTTSRPNQRPRLGWECLSPGQQMLMDTAAASYRGQLWRTPWALDRLHQRGLEDETIRDCGLGYCDGLTFREFLVQDRWLMRLGFGLGLLRTHRPDRTDAEPYETMAGRLVIPEYRAGHAIWFIGRLAEKPGAAEPAEEDESPPKYLGLPGSRPLLGYERVQWSSEMLLCEGPFDWLTAIQWDLPACSPCGTYLPSEQFAHLGDKVVYGVLDGDAAGDSGHERLARDLGDRYRPVFLPRDMDLNQFGQLQDGRERLRGLLGPSGAHLFAPQSNDSLKQPAWWRRLPVEFVVPWRHNGADGNGHAA